MMRKKLQAASKLSLLDWKLLVRAWFWLLLVDLGLRLIPFARLQRLVASPPDKPRTVGRHRPEADIQRTSQMVDIASRYHLYKMSCLRRSLVAQRLLFRQGMPTELRFGVNKDAGELKAHAWLEFDGAPIGEPETLTDRYFTLAASRRVQIK